jgi:hypothetical protein
MVQEQAPMVIGSFGGNAAAVEKFLEILLTLNQLHAVR